MNQSALYAVIEQAGFSVLQFSDHPQFFGNWLADIKRGTAIYKIVDDNREGWLTLWHHKTGSENDKLFEVENRTLDQEQTLSLLTEWLSAIPK